MRRTPSEYGRKDSVPRKETAMARIKINFSAKEKDLLKKLGITDNFNSLTDDDIMGIDEAVTEYLMDECIDEGGSVNAEGKVCEGIIEKLADF